MKKTLLLVISILLLYILFSSCENRSAQEMTVENCFFQNFLTDNSISLSSVLTKEYNLDSLESFFGEIPFREQKQYDGSAKRFTFDDVNKMFPVECIRQAKELIHYSVYKVAEGGYYYVFWNLNYLYDMSESNTYVAITAYVNSLNKGSDFNLLKEGVSTAQDVSDIASTFELSFTMSSGVYSFSLLDDGDVMMILYKETDRIYSRDDLVLKSKEIISKKTAESASYLANIINQDLPVAE